MKKIFITILSLFLFIPSVSFAAVLSLNADKNNFKENEEFLVQVFMDTEDASVNAVEGVVKFPADILSLKEIRDGNSAVNFWVKKPSLDNAGGISFSGITTGGFSGSNGFLFSMVLETKKIGDGTIVFDGVQVLQNDGLGTKVPIKTSSMVFSVSKEGSGTGADLQVLDTKPPESFKPFIAKDTSILDGKYFVVFSTVDKGVGIDHYEVKEGLLGDYIKAESPYTLSDQSLQKNIYIMAIDKSGNSRTEKVTAPNSNKYFLFGLIIGIILIICIFFLRKIFPKLLKR